MPKNPANQKLEKPLHILRYAMANMQRVVLHSTFSSLLARKSYACLFEDHFLKARVYTENTSDSLN